MKRLYTINRADFFNAQSLGQIPQDVQLGYCGSIWVDLYLTEEQASNYSFPINEA